MIIKGMQQRAGLLFLAKKTGRVLLILENQSWTVPTFPRKTAILNDAADLLKTYAMGKIVPIELYLSKDNGFEYGTYVCLVDVEFLVEVDATETFAWGSLDCLPKNLHSGLKNTLNDQTIRTKIETILELENASIEK
jgi:hypothetical protein